MSKFGQAIADRGMTVYRLAKITGTPQTTLYSYVRDERDSRKARYDTISKIAAALHAEVDDIM